MARTTRIIAGMAVVLLTVPALVDAAGGGGGGRGGCSDDGTLYLPRWTPAAGVTPQQIQNGMVCCLDRDGGDGTRMMRWTKSIADASTTVPFVVYAGTAGDGLAALAKVTSRPALVMTDQFGNPLWAFAGELDPGRIAAAVQALPAAVKGMPARVGANFAVAKAQADGAERATALAALARIGGLTGYPEAAAAQALRKQLIADGDQQLAAAQALFASDKPAARKQLDELTKRYAGTAIADQANAVLKQKAP